MNRFEELGVERSATSLEIHQAYRNLARLIHPDSCQDEKLRHLADLQMRRLNETVAVLLDPVQRQTYETEIDRLRFDSPEVAVIEQAYAAGQREVNKRMAAWSLLGGMALASIFWFVREGQSPPRILADSFMTMPSASFLEESGGDSAIQGRLDEFEGRLRILERKPGDRPSSNKRVSMAGEWIYRTAISPAASPGGLAAEKRIDLHIAESGNTLRGTYNSGYEISGGMLSTIMAFRFDGRPTDGLLTWNGVQGTTGTVQFRLLSANSLLASWWSSGTGKNANDHSDTTIFHRAPASPAN